MTTNPPIEAAAGLSTLLSAARRGARRRRVLWLVLLAGVTGAAGLALRARYLAPPLLTQYDTLPVVRGLLIVKVTATGSLQPVTQVDVGTEVSGTVEAVLVDFNDHVDAGQVLARLDTSQLAARERQSRAALALAEARVQEARATAVETANRLQRSQRMLARQLTAAEDHESVQASSTRASAGVAVALAQVHQAQAQLDYDRRLLEKAVVHAPISGIVLKRQVEPGQTVAAALQTPVLFTLAENLRQMLLNVQVDEADVGKVAAGQQADFSVDAYPNRRFPATISRVRYLPQTVDGVVTYEAQLEVDNQELLLRPGMTATADIAVQRSENVLLVPNAALRYTPPATLEQPAAAGNSSLVGRLMWRSPTTPRRVPEAAHAGARVWLLRDHEPVSIPVTVGETDGTSTEITAGELTPDLPLIVATQAPAP